MTEPPEPNPPRGPTCKKCMGATRLAEIEPHPTDPGTELRIFECTICHSMQAFVVSLNEPMPD
jgi:hypothetical protein